MKIFKWRLLYKDHWKNEQIRNQLDTINHFNGIKRGVKIRDFIFTWSSYWHALLTSSTDTQIYIVKQYDLWVVKYLGAMVKAWTMNFSIFCSNVDFASKI